MFVIYSITCKTTGRKYIGKTSNYKERCKMHKKYATMKKSDRSHYSLYVDMRNLGVDNFRFDVLDAFIDSEYEAALLEKKYISEYSPFYNSTGGGEGSFCTNDELIIELYTEHRVVAKVAEILNHDVDTIKRCLKRNNVQIDYEYLIEKRKISIESYDLKTGLTIKQYCSITDASIDVSGLETGKSAIRKCIDGKTKSYHKMGWREIKE